jgi:hypothetical protein
VKICVTAAIETNSSNYSIFVLYLLPFCIRKKPGFCHGGGRGGGEFVVLKAEVRRDNRILAFLSQASVMRIVTLF